MPRKSTASKLKVVVSEREAKVNRYALEEKVWPEIVSQAKEVCQQIDPTAVVHKAADYGYYVTGADGQPLSDGYLRGHIDHCDIQYGPYEDEATAWLVAFHYLLTEHVSAM